MAQQGVPSQQQIPPFSLDGLTSKSKLGMAGALPEQFYMQYGATASYNTSTTETTLLNNTATTAIGTLTLPSGSLSYGPLIATLNSAGQKVRGRLTGTITNTATPTLRLKVTLTNPTGTITAIIDTTALTMATITGTSRFTIEWEFVVAAYSATIGSIVGGMTAMYFTTGPAGVVWASPQTTTSSFDTTQSYTLNVTATWGASSASNAIIIQHADMWLDN